MDIQTNPATPADRAHEVGHEAKQAAQGVASTAAEETKRTTREAKDQARQLLSQTRTELTDQAATQQARAATGLRELAEQFSALAQGSDQDGLARSLVEDVSRRAGDAATWLDQRDPGTLLQEVRDVARRRPGTFLAVAAGVGVVAGRLSRGLLAETGDFGQTSGSGSDAAAPTESAQQTAAARGYAGGGLPGAGLPGTGMPTASSPTSRTTESTPVTPGASASDSAGMATTPDEGLPGVHRTTQPIMPDGTPTPIDENGRLGAPVDTRGA